MIKANNKVGLPVQELTLESKDSQALSTLVNELDGVLAIAQRQVPLFHVKN